MTGAVFSDWSAENVPGAEDRHISSGIATRQTGRAVARPKQYIAQEKAGESPTGNSPAFVF